MRCEHARFTSNENFDGVPNEKIFAKIFAKLFGSPLALSLYSQKNIFGEHQ